MCLTGLTQTDIYTSSSGKIYHAYTVPDWYKINRDIPPSITVLALMLIGPPSAYTRKCQKVTSAISDYIDNDCQSGTKAYLIFDQLNNLRFRKTVGCYYAVELFRKRVIFEVAKFLICI